MFTGDGTTEVCVTLDYKEGKFGKSSVSFTRAIRTLPLGSISTTPGMRKEKRKKKGISQFDGIAGRLEAPPFFLNFFSVKCSGADERRPRVLFSHRFMRAMKYSRFSN